MLYTSCSLNHITTYINHFHFKRTSLIVFSLTRGFSFHAHKVFDKSPQRHISFINDQDHQRLTSFIQQIILGKKPTKYELCTALNSCSKTLNSHLGSQIHAKIIHIGFDLNLYINSSLVNVYAKCGLMGDARKVFDEMQSHDQVSWTSIICGLSQNGRGREALCLFKQMLMTLVRPNCFTYVSVISASTEQESVFKCGELLHAHVVKLGHERNSFVRSCLIDYYSKCGKMDKAVVLAESCIVNDHVVFNTMISAYSHNQQGKDALNLFKKMHSENAGLSQHTLTSVLDACGALTVVQQGKQIHALVMKMGSDQNSFVVGALLDMYSKCGNIDEACRVFDQTEYKNNILWTSLITAYAQSGRGLDALKVFDHLLMKTGFLPDHVCFTVVLTACKNCALVDKGIDYFKKMRLDYYLVPEIDQYACLIDLYARKGDLEGAKRVIAEMPYDANAVMWSSILSSCKEYGNVEFGREAAYKLFELEPQSPVPYLNLADMYASVGLWNEVQNVRKLMNENGVTKSLAGWSKLGYV